MVTVRRIIFIKNVLLPFTLMLASACVVSTFLNRPTYLLPNIQDLPLHDNQDRFLLNSKKKSTAYLLPHHLTSDAVKSDRKPCYPFKEDPKCMSTFCSSGWKLSLPALNNFTIKIKQFYENIGQRSWRRRTVS